MNQKIDNQKMINVILLVVAAIFSFVASMMVIFGDFGGMYVGAPSYYAYLCLFCSYLAGWSKIFIILLGLIYLALTGLLVLLILTYFGKVPEEQVKPMRFYAFIGTGVVFILTLVLLGIFAAQANPYALEWWPEVGFYGGLIGSMIVAICLGLHLYFENRAKIYT